MKINPKLVVFLALVVLIVLLDRNFGWSESLLGPESLAAFENLLEENRASAILLYIFFTVLGSVVLALPGITFAIAAGALFGPWEGTLWCVVAVTLGAGLSFLVSRYFLHDSLKPVIMKNRHLKKWLFDEAGNNDLIILMVTRLVPLFPFNLQNFAYGITDISFSRYMIFTFLFIIPGTAMYTVGTAGLVDPDNRLLYIVIAGLLAAAVFFISSRLKKHYLGKDPDEPEEEGGGVRP